jgi:GAF domain-containing protein
MTDRQPIDPAAAFAELGRIRLAETDLDGVLLTVAGLAKRAVPGADEASVTLVRAEDAHTAAFTGELARMLDEWQYRHDSGPCLAAAATGGTVSLPDLAAEDSWRQFAGRALTAGVLSSLSVGLPVIKAVTGALNLYATKPEAFDAHAIVLAETFAGYAAVSLANAHLYDMTATLARQMQTAMRSRAVIEQAKGIIMAERRCSADEAFKLLSKISQDSNRKLHDVAAALVARAEQSDGA